MQINILTAGDTDMFVAYCLKFSQWQKYEGMAATEPDLVMTRIGHRPSPYFRLASRASDLYFGVDKKGLSEPDSLENT